MKKLFINVLPVVSLGLLLSACSNEVSVNYFLEHPHALQRQLQTCMSNQDRADAKFVQNCQTAVNAEAILREYLQAEQSDPESFGEHILRAQYDASLLAQKVTDSEIVLPEIIDPRAKQVLNKNLAEMKRVLAEKRQQIKVLLAVAGLNSPE